MGDLTAYVVLDLLSAALLLAVAFAFARLARWSHQARHNLVAGGLALVAGGFLFVAASQSGGGPPDARDLARIGFQLGGAILLLYAYVGARLRGRPRVLWLAFAWLATVLLLTLLFWVIPPFARFQAAPEALAAAYGAASVCYFGCALMSGYGWHRRPTWGRAMVPLAFLAWAASMYTWIFIVLGAGDRFLPVVYGWRLAAVALLAWAMLRRPRPPPEVSLGAP